MAEAVLPKFREITALPYAEQAKWYLNAFWNDIQSSNPNEPEEVWNTVEAFISVDLKNGKKGNELNEVLAHHFLQKIGRTLTALELRAELRKIDLDANGEMALIEYLLFVHKRDVVKCCTNPQGGETSSEELAQAQAQLDELSTAYDKLQVQLAEQKQLEAAAKQAEEEARKTEAAALDAEAKVKAAEQAVREVEAEAKAVDDALQAEKDKYNSEVERLTALSTDDSVGIVKRNMAVQQLAQLKGSDPLPLQKAKITQEAVVRRVQKARQAAEAETAKAVEARAKAVSEREAAEAARTASEQKTREVEAAIKDIELKIKEAEEYIEELKKRDAIPHGAIWWMEREIAEKKKYLPKRFQ